MPDNPTFLFICEEGDSSCAYYRAVIPVMGLRELGFPADIASTMVELPDGRWTGIVTKGGQRYMIDPPPDVLVVRRVNDANGKLARTKWDRAVMAGQRIFIDVDDDVWNVPEHNPAYGTMSPEELMGWSDDMATATGIIASTDALAESARTYTDAPVFVCRNGIDARIYRGRNWKHDRPILRLGWMGTTDYRGRDLAMIVPALREALKAKSTTVEFWHLGGRENLLPIAAILGEKFPVRVRVWPWVPISSLPYSLAQIDCAVLPMEPGQFNEARSNASGLALMAAGVPFIASSTAEYERLGVPVMADSVRHIFKGSSYDYDHAGWVDTLKKMVDGKPGRRWRIHWRQHGERQLAQHSPGDTACQYLRLVGADVGV